MSDVDARLARLEARLTRIERLLARLAGTPERVPDAVASRAATLDPDPGGAVLPGTQVRCTEEVLHRVRRIPVGFVRDLVARRVAERARAAGVDVVERDFFERAATF